MKKLITIMMVAFAAVAAKADLVLYWQVADTTFNGTYAVLQGVNGSETTSLAGMKLNSSGVTTVESYILSFSDYSQYIVALLDGDGNTLAVSTESYAQSTLKSYIYDRGSSAQPPASPWQVSAFTIPEPTSALMLLVGLAGLALKRKNA
ncbi:MAG: PEP-CTERM sorting domain-containing protein [Kiritimatiellae bacterium]|nr:PEP-CTERM sorting domain-containing protein [Kiritimatiellia bacterium]